MENKDTNLVISLKNVSYSYSQGEDKKIKAVDNVSLDICEGQFVAIIGHNGSGKSTLAKIFNGLLIPRHGTIDVLGYSTKDKENTFTIRKNVGIVFQNPDNQMVASVVEDDIAFGPENLGVPREEIIKRVDWALNAVGMIEHKKGTPFKMSGGQKQRIAIAGILAMKPKVLILDESTAMLDPRGRREVLEVIHKLNKTENITVILITHYMDEALEADRVIVMNDGQIIDDGTPRDVFQNHQKLVDANLKLPLVVDIVRELKERGIPIERDILNEDELVEHLCQLL